jgi:hypothetical protein
MKTAKCLFIKYSNIPWLDRMSTTAKIRKIKKEKEFLLSPLVYDFSG